MSAQNNFENAQTIYDTFKQYYKNVSIVDNKKLKCITCGKDTKKYYELRIRCEKRIKAGSRTKSFPYYNPKVGYIPGSNKAFKHLGYVCSKPCEVMFMLKLV